ncbi:hypothetical protein G7Z17_g2403 [Cylindrodendrum hubeiense]|uniref:NAD(P)-binding domain-containing protein n=1 Tax=Cylindrodendrum hubeiense TaxID=595255 RepID=A0A9P5LBQ6_9HYPO|nr:hypothetical protein G7Z17_g2403 [Cylindrodendrum hubeiense]
MVNVAVLGGTGHVGKTIVEVLHEDPNHSVIVLSRKAATTEIGALLVAVDYTDVEALKTVLESHNIHTVISCVGVHDQAIADVQAAVIQAAETSSTTKRFISSNWATPVEQIAPWTQLQRQGPDALRQTNLEWTEILTGYFLDYWGMPRIKSHMTSMLPAIDIANKVAGIPGTGNEVISFSYTFDVAKVISRMLELDTWEEATYIIGDKLTWNEFLHLAEEVRGSKFDVQYDTDEKLSRFQITELPNHKAVYPFFPKEHLQFLYAVLGRLMIRGDFDLPIEKALNRRFPDLKLLTGPAFRQPSKVAGAVGAIKYLDLGLSSQQRHLGVMSPGKANEHPLMCDALRKSVKWGKRRRNKDPPVIKARI